MTLDARLRAEGLAASTWSNGPSARYGAHTHAFDKVIVVASGVITFSLPGSGSRALALAVGERLELPAGTRHDAVVGPHGVTCLEAHLPAGGLAVVTRRAAGEW